MRCSIVAVALILTFSQVQPASADCAIAEVLERDARNARLWNAGWGVGLGISAIGYASYGLLRAGCPACAYVTAIKATIGSIWSLTIDRVDVVRVERAPTCDEQVLSALTLTAEDERIPWFARVQGYLLNVAGLLYLGFAHDEWQAATIGSIMGIVTGEIRLFTRPYGAVRAVRKRPRVIDWALIPSWRPEFTGE